MNRCHRFHCVHIQFQSSRKYYSVADFTKTVSQDWFHSLRCLRENGQAGTSLCQSHIAVCLGRELSWTPDYSDDKSRWSWEAGLSLQSRREKLTLRNSCVMQILRSFLPMTSFGCLLHRGVNLTGDPHTRAGQWWGPPLDGHPRLSWYRHVLTLIQGKMSSSSVKFSNIFAEARSDVECSTLCNLIDQHARTVKPLCPTHCCFSSTAQFCLFLKQQLQSDARPRPNAVV